MKELLLGEIRRGAKKQLQTCGHTTTRHPGRLIRKHLELLPEMVTTEAENGERGASEWKREQDKKGSCHYPADSSLTSDTWNPFSLQVMTGKPTSSLSGPHSPKVFSQLLTEARHTL